MSGLNVPVVNFLYPPTVTLGAWSVRAQGDWSDVGETVRLDFARALVLARSLAGPGSWTGGQIAQILQRHGQDALQNDLIEALRSVMRTDQFDAMLVVRAANQPIFCGFLEDWLERMSLLSEVGCPVEPIVYELLDTTLDQEAVRHARTGRLLFDLASLAQTTLESWDELADTLTGESRACPLPPFWPQSPMGWMEKSLQSHHGTPVHVAWACAAQGCPVAVHGRPVTLQVWLAALWLAHRHLGFGTLLGGKDLACVSIGLPMVASVADFTHRLERFVLDHGPFERMSLVAPGDLSDPLDANAQTMPSPVIHLDMRWMSRLMEGDGQGRLAVRPVTIVPANDVTLGQVAERFCELLRQEIGEERFEQVIRRNHARELPAEQGVCHSHDFCDANRVMDQAVHEVLNQEGDSSGAVQLDLASQDRSMAWCLAIEFMSTSRAASI